MCAFQNKLCDASYHVINLEQLEALDSNNVIKGKPKSIIQLAIKIFKLVPEDQYERINRERRQLALHLLMHKMSLRNTGK